MPWRAVDTMDLRREFVTLARTETIPVRELCRRFGFSPKTDYTWLNRHARGGALTRLGAWLARLDIQVWHGLPCHPQPQGKVERFHQTVTAEVLRPGGLPGLAHCQAAFDAWRPVYNHERPHQVLGDTTPASRYQSSPRSFPAMWPEIVYGPDDLVRRVHSAGQVMLHGHTLYISEALRGETVALRPTSSDGVYAVSYCRHHLRTIDLSQPAHAAID